MMYKFYSYVKEKRITSYQMHTALGKATLGLYHVPLSIVQDHLLTHSF